MEFILPLMAQVRTDSQMSASLPYPQRGWHNMISVAQVLSQTRLLGPRVLQEYNHPHPNHIMGKPDRMPRVLPLEPGPPWNPVAQPHRIVPPSSYQSDSSRVQTLSGMMVLPQFPLFSFGHKPTSSYHAFFYLPDLINLSKRGKFH